VKRAALVLFVAACGASLVACPGKSDPVADAGDGGADATDATDAGPPEWRPVVEHLPGALLAIWGTSSKDLWTVGGPLGNGGEALVLRFDGATWKTQHVGGDASYWWVHGTGANDVWMVGEKGRITHWDGARFEEKTSGTSATLFGVWAAAPDDAWAVGGTPDQPNETNDVVLHWDGASWKPEALPVANKVALFKVWGMSKDDVWVVGANGVVWRRARGAWTQEAKGVAQGRLTTVAGCSPNEIYAVGGRDLLVWDGASWKRDATTMLVNDINGVSCGLPPRDGSGPPRDYGRVVIVGGGSLKLRLVNGKWEDDFGSRPFSDLHGAWIDETGAMWGVGGAFNASPKPGASREGVIARFARDTVPSTLER
jgi:hypothetical protein